MIDEAPNPRLMRWLRIALGVAVGLVVLVFILVAVANFSGDPTPTAAPPAAAAPPTVATANRAIRSAVVVDGVLHVDALVAAAWDAKDYPPQSAMIVEAIGKAVQAGAADAQGATRLALDVNASSTDRLGHKGEVRLFTLFVDMADLRAARFDNLSLARTLNLVTGTAMAREGLRVAALYCASDEGRGDGRAFCEKAAVGRP